MPTRLARAILLLSLLAPPLAPAAERAMDLRAEAQRCASAMLAPDPSNAIECMNPRLVVALGGKDAAERVLSRKLHEMDELGAKFEGATVGEPKKPILIGGREFTLIPEKLRIRVKDGVLVQEAYLLAVREKGEKTWTFFDAAPTLPQGLAQIYPDTPAAEFDKLKIPDRKPAVLER